MPSSSKIDYAPVNGAEEVFTDDFLALVAHLHGKLSSRVRDAREARLASIDGALRRGLMPGHLDAGPANNAGWKVPDVPEELRKPGIEISGPASITPMFINALNPGPEGERAEGYLDDDEDSAGHRLVDTVRAALNRHGAIERTLTYFDSARQRKYEIQPGELPFFMHRERGLHLDEPDLRIDGQPVPASILGTAMTLYHAGVSHTERGQGVYFYVPKLESAVEAALYRDMIDEIRNQVSGLNDSTVRVIALVESLPAVWQMEEILHALGPYAAGLNAARWDLKASILEYVMAQPKSVWPDRFGVDIKTTEFFANIFRRLVAVCLKHDAVPIGGMATALPSRDEEVNLQAAASIRADKEWEAQQGFLRGWVAHIYHMGPAAAPFKELAATGWTPGPEMADPDRYPVSIDTPEGPLTQEGTRQNVRTLIEYIEGWLGGRGAKGIDRLAGREGSRPALMEDLATARISVAQIAQRVVHSSVGEDTEQVHDLDLVKGIVTAEGEDIIRLLGTGASQAQVQQYQDSVKIALRWIKNYTEFDFRSLGSYSRPQLSAIASEPDAF